MLIILVLSCMHQAIEGFALLVKKTAQTLQSFGTELAETELPNEIQATNILLGTHTNKKDKMKVTPLTHTYITHMVSLYISVYSILVMYLDYISPSVCLCVQEDLLVALGQGSRLLESINEPVVRNPDHNMNQDEMENMATVQRFEPLEVM